MNFDGDSSPDWIDDELRRVPLPEGLVARLRQLAVADDDQLDAALRHVALPKGLLLRLREIATYDDATIDAALRDLALPEGLLGGLASIPATPPEQIDFELSDVPLPVGFLDRLSATAVWAVATDTEEAPAEDAAAVLATPGPAERSLSRPRRQQASTLSSRLSALAAVVAFFAVGYLAMATTFFDRWLKPQSGPPVAVVPNQPSQYVIDRTANLPKVAVAVPPPKVVIDQVADDARQKWVGSVMDQVDALAAADEMANTTQLTTPLGVLRLSVEPVVPWHGLQGEAEVIADRAEDLVPQPRVVTLKRAKGIAPLWKDADLLLAQIQQKANPRVGLVPSMKPEKDGSLLSCQIPLTTETDSYETAWNLLGGEKLTGKERRQAQQRLEAEVRPEEFLAAMDYEFSPAAAGTLALRTAAGVSPFGDPQKRLLQVAVLAGELPPQAREPVDLTVLVDTSSRMTAGRGLEKVRQALRGLIVQLAADDRISLIACDETARVLVKEAAPSDAPLLGSAIESLSAAHASNLGIGLRLASSVAQGGGETARARRIVLLSHGASEMRSEALRAAEALLHDAAVAGTTFSVVDLSAEGRDDQTLQRLAAAGAGRLVRVDSARQAQASLQEVLNARPQQVADDARLIVTFNPRAVASYRLIGHEAASVIGLSDGPVTVALHPGDVATALFEIELRAGGEPLVATAQLTWREPGQSAARQVTQPISRWQIADSILETPPSVQTAAVAAETAELLRKSYFAPPNSSSLARVRQVAAELDPSVAEKPSFQRLLLLIDRAAKSGIH